MTDIGKRERLKQLRRLRRLTKRKQTAEQQRLATLKKVYTRPIKVVKSS